MRQLGSGEVESAQADHGPGRMGSAETRHAQLREDTGREFPRSLASAAVTTRAFLRSPSAARCQRPFRSCRDRLQKSAWESVREAACASTARCRKLRSTPGFNRPKSRAIAEERGELGKERSGRKKGDTRRKFRLLWAKARYTNRRQPPRTSSPSTNNQVSPRSPSAAISIFKHVRRLRIRIPHIGFLNCLQRNELARQRATTARR
jgi:hypothetical protein